jgi:hypothetical protein
LLPSFGKVALADSDDPGTADMHIDLKGYESARTDFVSFIDDHQVKLGRSSS